jgi:NADH-quinone oxidoreductase subunit A
MQVGCFLRGTRVPDDPPGEPLAARAAYPQRTHIAMLENFAAVLIFGLLATVFVFGNLALGWLVRPRRPGMEKNSIYECGEPTIGSTWIRFNSRFYTVALVYLLFDVEVVVLMPALLVLRHQIVPTGFGFVALVSLLVFLGLLVLGLAYEWFYGNLDWIRAAEEIAPGTEAAGTDETKDVERLRA